jgi:hypothetical protein
LIGLSPEWSIFLIIELFIKLFTFGNDPNNTFVMAYLAAKDCEFVLHRVFFCPVEMFKILKQVTSPSIY